MTKPHTLSLTVVESSYERRPPVAAVRLVLGRDAVSLVHERWRDEAPKGADVNSAFIVDYGGYARDPFTLG